METPIRDAAKKGGPCVRDPPEEAIMKNAATSVAAGQAKDATSSVVSLRGRGSHWKEEAPTLSGRIVPSIARRPGLAAALPVPS